MCGVMADMQIIFNLVKILYPKIYDILEEKEENCGDFIGNNLINQGLNNLFTNDILNNETSLLIWDLLFLEGNIILIKSFLAIYAALENILLKSERSIMTFKNIIDNDLKNIKFDNDKFIDILFTPKINLDINYIDEERFKFSSQIAEAFENDTIDTIKSKLKVSYDKQLNIQLDKTMNCNKNWPYCINDTFFENVTQIVFYTTLSKQKIGERKEDWFFKGLKLKNELKNKNKKINNANKDEENKYNIFIERRPHYCTLKNEQKKEDKEKNNNDFNKEKEKNENKININDENSKKENTIDKNSSITRINEQNTNTINIKSDSNEKEIEEDFK
jgi:hypothetical protein